MHTISTSLERTLDVNAANTSSFPRNALILTVELLEQMGKGFLIARFQVSSSFESLIELVGCEPRQKDC